MTCIHTLINCAAPYFDRVGILSGCGGWDSRSAWTSKGLAQLIQKPRMHKGSASWQEQTVTENQGNATGFTTLQ